MLERISCTVAEPSFVFQMLLLLSEDIMSSKHANLSLMSATSLLRLTKGCTSFKPPSLCSTDLRTSSNPLSNKSANSGGGCNVAAGSTWWLVVGKVAAGSAGIKWWLVVGKVAAGKAGTTWWLVVGKVAAGSDGVTWCLVVGKVAAGNAGITCCLVVGKVAAGSAGITWCLVVGKVAAGSDGITWWLVVGKVAAWSAGTTWRPVLVVGRMSCMVVTGTVVVVDINCIIGNGGGSGGTSSSSS